MSHFCLTGEDHWLCRRGWQHSPMGARVQRQTLCQPGQTRVYWWSEICQIFFLNWVHRCIYNNQDACYVSGARYQALLIPDCPGALNDLAHSGSLARILSHFISQQSEVVSLHLKYELWDWFSWRLCDCRARVCCGTGCSCSLLRYRGTQVDIQWIQHDWGEW